MKLPANQSLKFSRGWDAVLQELILEEYIQGHRLMSMASYLASDGLQPNSDGLKPKSDAIQYRVFWAGPSHKDKPAIRPEAAPVLAFLFVRFVLLVLLDSLDSTIAIDPHP